MNDALSMRELQRACNVAKDGDPLFNAERAFLAKTRPQRISLDEWHRVVKEIACFSSLQQWDDVGMLERCREPHFARKAFSAQGLANFGVQHLHDDHSPERRLLGHKDVR